MLGFKTELNWPTLDKTKLTYWHLALSSQLFAQSSSLSAKNPWPPWSTGRSPPRISISSKMQPAKVCQLVCPLGRKASQPACRGLGNPLWRWGLVLQNFYGLSFFQLLDFNFVLLILKFRFVNCYFNSKWNFFFQILQLLRIYQLY